MTQSGHDSHGLDAAMQRTWLCVHAVDIHIGCEEPCGKIDLIRLDWRQTFRTMPMYGLCICPVYGKFTNQMCVKYTANYTVMHPQRKLSKLRPNGKRNCDTDELTRYQSIRKYSNLSLSLFLIKSLAFSALF